MAVTAFCAQTGAAFANQYFVNGDATGDNANTCLRGAAGAPGIGPCLTIAHALALAQANTGADQVVVADEAYPETLTVTDGTLLRTLDATAPKPVIDSPSAVAAAVTIAGSGGSVDGFEIRSGQLPVSVATPGNVTNNDFPTTTPPTNPEDVFVSAVAGSVLITGNDAFGVQGLDGGSGNGDFTATNVTFADNVLGDIRLQDDAMTLDSSILEGAILKFGSATCAISFSRGPATGTPGDLTDCNDFQTIADPMFVGASNYHLQAASTMIDAGNPLAPGVGVLDIDGNSRALDATPACTGNVDRRDIGADELVPATPSGCNPPAPPAAKKCKKGRKLKKGKCVKKKRKKKH